MEPAIKQAEPAIIAALNDSEPKVRATAAHLLGMLVTDHLEVIQPLLKALQDPDVLVRVNAAGSLGRAKYEFELVVPALCSLLGDNQVHGTAVQALAKLAGPGKKFVASVERVFKQPGQRHSGRRG